MVACTRVLMGVARCIFGNCFVGKYFVVCFSTTKTMKFYPLPEKYLLYSTYSTCAWFNKTEVRTTIVEVGGIYGCG